MTARWEEEQVDGGGIRIPSTSAPIVPNCPRLYSTASVGDGAFLLAGARDNARARARARARD